MNKIDMMSVWQGIEYKLVKQLQMHLEETGLIDLDLLRKIMVVRGAIKQYLNERITI